MKNHRSSLNRFWPCLGNHDFGKEQDARPYFDYFKSLNHQYYYDFMKGNIHFFSVCSDRRCPDGIFPDSKQLRWLENKIKTSHLPWKIVFFHHPPYSSAVITPDVLGWPSECREKNSERTINPPFERWGGVSAVLSGHSHVYERLMVNGVPYIINGLGGDVTFTFPENKDSENKGSGDKDAEDQGVKSIVKFSGDHGALLVEEKDEGLSFQFITLSEKVIDRFVVKK